MRPCYDKFLEIGDDNHLTPESLCVEFRMEGFNVNWDQKNDEAFQVFCDFLYEYGLLTKFRKHLEIAHDS